MKKAKVSELKARLSSYLADVRSGDTVIVCDRTTPIARLAPLDPDDEHVRIRESARSIRDLKKVRPVRLRRKVNLDRVLREMRGES